MLARCIAATICLAAIPDLATAQSGSIDQPPPIAEQNAVGSKKPVDQKDIKTPSIAEKTKPTGGATENHESSKRYVDKAMINPAPRSESTLSSNDKWALRWSAAQAIGSIVSAILVAITLFYTTRATTAANTAAQAARDAINLDRAWIGAPKVTLIRRDDGRYDFEFIIKNSGKFPVEDVWIGAEIAQQSINTSMDKFRKQGLAYFKSKGRSDLRNSIVPQDTLHITSSDDNPALKAIFDPSIAPHLKYGRVTDAQWLAGSIVYTPEYDGKLRATNFAVPLKRENMSLENPPKSSTYNAH